MSSSNNLSLLYQTLLASDANAFPMFLLTLCFKSCYALEKGILQFGNVSSIYFTLRWILCLCGWVHVRQNLWFLLLLSSFSLFTPACGCSIQQNFCFCSAKPYCWQKRWCFLAMACCGRGGPPKLLQSCSPDSIVAPIVGLYQRHSLLIWTGDSH